LDYGKEPTRFGFNIEQMTAANFVAQLALVDALMGAVDNVTLYSWVGNTVQARDIPVGVKATVENAQREAKWRVSYIDATNPIGNGSFEIGMPDLTLLVAGEGKMDITAGAGAALVTAIENAVVSRLANAVTVSQIIHVGRNV
jgi:hypothetical protein